MRLWFRSGPRVNDLLVLDSKQGLVIVFRFYEAAWFRRRGANFPHLTIVLRLRSYIGHSNRRLTVSRPLQTPPRPGDYNAFVSQQERARGSSKGLACSALPLSVLLSPVRVSALKSASTSDLLKYVLRLIKSDLLQRARTLWLCPVACHSCQK